MLATLRVAKNILVAVGACGLAAFAVLTATADGTSFPAKRLQTVSFAHPGNVNAVGRSGALILETIWSGISTEGARLANLASSSQSFESIMLVLCGVGFIGLALALRRTRTSTTETEVHAESPYAGFTAD